MEKKDNSILAQLQQEMAALQEKVAELAERLSSIAPLPEKEAAYEEPLDIMLDVEVPFVVPSRKEELSGEKKKPSAGKPKQPKENPVPLKPADTVYAWHTDTPASPLSNILSGIAIRERGIFINVLFKENPQLFLDTVSALNAMQSLKEAEAYIKAGFPEWNLASDVVYRFMMAVRRKLN